MQLNDKKVINAWCFFDWANSAYSLVITTAIFPAYYSAVTQATFGGDIVQFFGMSITNTVLYSYALSISFLIIALLSPILSGIADYGGKKKLFMRFFTTLGAISCLILFFFTGANVELGIIAAVVASIGFSGGLVFYNAFLPEIVTPDRYDAVSAKGYSMGYFGSVLLLIINLLMIQFSDSLGMDKGLITRICFLMVGVWWIGFSQITFLYLQDTNKNPIMGNNLFRKGFEELKKVLQSIKKQPNIKKFLFSFFCYSTGVQTIILIAALFAAKELKMESTELIILVLLLQIVAIGGAYLTAKLSAMRGNKFTLLILLFVWAFICLTAFFIYDKTQFYLLGVLLGMVMGGIQSLSRATYSKLLPEQTKDTASYFSFYDILEKSSIVLGTFLNGFAEQQSDNMRIGILALGFFFIFGAIFMSMVQVKPATVIHS
ncbi:MAG: MFS transporter [Thermoflexibacter sp.]|jgi:UMF1 family MFS transporter|nr:MFS transporter [Thermoflexibacter sp.]